MKDINQLNLDKSTWEGWLNSIIVWAAQEPIEFLMTVLLILSPLFVISLILSWRLVKIFENQKKENIKKSKREANYLKIRKTK